MGGQVDASLSAVSNRVRSTIVAISTTPHHPAHRREMNPEVFRDLLMKIQEGVRSFIITFDVYVILNIF